jgi:hypothetical protein
MVTARLAFECKNRVMPFAILLYRKNNVRDDFYKVDLIVFVMIRLM